MPGLDKTGPEGKGSLTGRKLGRCGQASEDEKLEQLGRGMALRRREGGGRGQGRRLRSGKGGQ